MALDPIDGILQLGDDLVKHFFPDAAQQAQAREKMQQLRDNGELAAMAERANLRLAQIQVDDDEVKKGGWFSDWRDGIGWTCTLSFFWQYFGYSFSTFWLEVFHVTAPVLPHLDLTMPENVMLGLLGIGGNSLKLLEGHIAKRAANGPKL